MSKLTISAGEQFENLVFGLEHEYQNADVFGILENSSCDDNAIVIVKDGGVVRNFTVAGEALADRSGNLVLESGGTAHSITVDDCGELLVNNGAACENVLLVNGGNMWVRGASTQAYGIALEWGNLSVEQSASITGVEVRGEKGQLTINSGTSVAESIIREGTVKVVNGILADSVVTGGAVSLEGTDGTTLLRNAVLLGGTVTDGSKVAKNNKARIEGLSLGVNATVSLQHNPTLAGTISLQGTLSLASSTSADDLTLQFDLRKLEDTNAVRLHGYSHLHGKYSISLVMDKNQARQQVHLLDGIDEEPGEETRIKATITIDDKNYKITEGLEQEIGFLSVSMERNAEGELVFSVGNAAICETKRGLSWEAESVGGIVQFASDESFADAVQVGVATNAVDCLAGVTLENIWWRVVDGEGTVVKDAEELKTSGITGIARCFAGDCDGVEDVFLAASDMQWERVYRAVHVGNGDWEGTGEVVELKGKTKYIDFFLGGGDTAVLHLNDGDDALFVDDIYSYSCEQKGKENSRLSNLTEIFAGKGDDLVDLTSKNFAFGGEQVSIHGGEGDDVLWGGALHNLLYGDEGNDRLVGGESGDILWGGADNDSMHGGGGDDYFCFGQNWGQDTIEQLNGGNVTLCFFEGITALNVVVEGNTVRMGANTITIQNWSGDVNFWFEAG